MTNLETITISLTREEALDFLYDGRLCGQAEASIDRQLAAALEREGTTHESAEAFLGYIDSLPHGEDSWEAGPPRKRPRNPLEKDQSRTFKEMREEAMADPVQRKQIEAEAAYLRVAKEQGDASEVTDKEAPLELYEPTVWDNRPAMKNTQRDGIVGGAGFGWVRASEAQARLDARDERIKELEEALEDQRQGWDAELEARLYRRFTRKS